MLRYFIAILLTAATLTASAATLSAAEGAPRTGLAVVVSPVKRVPAGDVVKTSLVRPQPGAGSTDALEPTATAARQAPASKDEAPREVSMEMVLAAVALMLAISMRRLGSGPQ